MNFICNVKRINLLNSEEKNTLVRDAKKKKKKIKLNQWYEFINLCVNDFINFSTYLIN